MKLAKYLKPFLGMIIIIIFLLFLQASSDLSLPEYMSKIVNTGITKNGVENESPEVITKGKLDFIVSNLITSEEDKNFVIEKYKLVDSNSIDKKLIEKFPEIASNESYFLDSNNKDEILRLNEILKKPEAIINFAKIKGMDIKQLLSSDSQNLFGNLDEKTLDTMIKENAILFVTDEYIELGADMQKIQTDYILKTSGTMLAISFVSLLAVIIVTLLAAKISASLSKKLRNDVFAKVVSFSGNEFDKFSTATLITRCTNDVQQIQGIFVMVLRMVIYAPIMGVGGILKVLATKSSMTFIIFIAITLIVCTIAFLFYIVSPKFKIMQTLVDRVNLVVREALTGIMVIRAFNTQKYEEKKFEKANEDLTKNNLFVSKIMSSMFPILSLIMNVTTVAILWFGAKRIEANVIQIGDMMAFIQYAMQIMFSFLMISMVSIMLPRAAVAADRISEVLESEILIKDPENPISPNENIKGIVEFKNVSFRYPGADESVIENISFVAKPSQTTAFIGSTGSGKSTLINLIPRFYDVTEGEILVDDCDVRKMTQKKLRDKLGYISQKAILFTGTIESNIKYSDENISDVDMEKAAMISQSLDFINKKELKFKDEISQGGSNVSGGQRQRLSIARAVAKKPEIFIFDDSFSALDYATDRKLRETIKTELKEATVLIVAQRISTIRNAEQIIVLDEGKIVGKGTHKELLNSCDVYKQIALSQLSKEELATDENIDKI